MVRHLGRLRRKLGNLQHMPAGATHAHAGLRFVNVVLLSALFAKDGDRHTRSLVRENESWKAKPKSDRPARSLSGDSTAGKTRAWTLAAAARFVPIFEAQRPRVPWLACERKEWIDRRNWLVTAGAA